MYLARLGAPADEALQHATSSPSSAGDVPRMTAVRGPMHSLLHLPGTTHLLALHHGLLKGRRNLLRTIDLEAKVEMGQAHELLEAYDIVAAAWHPARGGEVIAGSVHSGVCTSCRERQFIGSPPMYSLCHHKSNAQAAAICVFDVRAATAMCARYSMHHRSLYPHIVMTRGHYVLTSHAGTPLAAWDLRGAVRECLLQRWLLAWRVQIHERPPVGGAAPGALPGG